MWAHRLLLEGKCHGQSAVATLTYSNDFGPVSNSLRPQQVQRFIKRLRKAVAPRSLRFYVCGEYGEDYHRPHYHAILYNLDPVIHAEPIKHAWGLGHVHLDSLTWESAQYVCRYVTKKLSNPNDLRTLQKLNGRTPEFARMSLRPGLGASAMQTLGAQLSRSESTVQAIGTFMDVPLVLQHSKKCLPLGRYLRRRLRNEMGHEEVGQPEAYKEKKARELRALSEAIGVAAAVETLKLQPEIGRIRNIEARHAVHKPRTSL